MQTSTNILAASIMVVLSMATLALVLPALPELHFIAGPFKELSGPYSANLIDLLFDSGSPDDFACGAAGLRPGCSYWGLAVHALVFELTPESQVVLLRHFMLTLGGWFLFVGVGFQNFIRAWLAEKSILTTPVQVSVPVAFAQWVLTVLAMAYLLSLATLS